MAGKIRHLLERDGRYSARVAVPPTLRPIIGKRELTRALGADRAKALRMLPGVVAEMQLELDNARLIAVRQSPPTYRAGRLLSEKQIARTHYDSELVTDRNLRVRGAYSEEYATLFRPGFVDALKRIASGNAESGEAEAVMGWAVDQFAANGHLNAPRGSAERRALLLTLATIQLEITRRLDERDSGKPENTPFHPLLAPETADERKQRIIGPHSTKLLADLLPRFLGERRPQPDTVTEYNVAIRMFNDVVGEELPIFKITRQHIHSFKDALLKTPTLASKRFKGMSLMDAIEANQKLPEPHPTLDPHTINNKWIARMHSLFGWCVRNDVIPDNPAAGIKVENVEKSKPARIPFTRTDLAAIFSQEQFDTSKPFSERQWAMLIAAFSGMRPAEIAQLKLDDIRTERGTLIFSVEEQTKNRQSQRIVPVHSKLLALGLEDRVKALMAAKETRLFPEWYAKETAARARGKLTRNNRYSTFIPRWFNDAYRPKIGISDRRKVFYSFRHTFKTELSRAGVVKSVRDELCGHDDPSAGAAYVHDTSTTVLKEAIEKLKFDGFSL